MGKASDNVFPKLIYAMQSANQAAPSDSSWKVYAKPDGIYARSSNAVVGPFGAASSGSIAANGARVYNSGNIALNNGSTTLLTFDSERYDDAGYHSTVSNTGRLTVPSAGRYLVGAVVQFTSSPSEPSYVALKVSGATFIAVQSVAHAQTQIYVAISSPWDCTGGTEYFEVHAFVSAGSKNAIAASAFSPEFWIERLGDT